GVLNAVHTDFRRKMSWTDFLRPVWWVLFCSWWLWPYILWSARRPQKRQSVTSTSSFTPIQFNHRCRRNWTNRSRKDGSWPPLLSQSKCRALRSSSVKKRIEANLNGCHHFIQRPEPMPPSSTMILPPSTATVFH